MANGLNTSQSIVDFLKSRGLKAQTGEKFPLFGTRKELFQRLGLSDQLGVFRGTSAQNTALLRNLQQSEKSTGISITSENLFDVALTAQGGGTQLPSPIAETPSEEVLKTAEGQAPTQQQALTQEPSPTALTTQQQLPVQAQQFPLAETLLPQIPGAEDVAQQALETVQRGATFPLRLEAQTAEKEAVRLTAQRQKESFIQEIASRGLFFSGVKKKGLQVIEADKLSQILGVDRKFALLIAQGLERATQDIVKEAQKGRQEAIQSLSALGFAINPLTGRVEPTLAARGKAEQARQFEVGEVRREAAATEQARQFEEREKGLAPIGLFSGATLGEAGGVVSDFAIDAFSKAWGGAKSFFGF